MSRRLTRMNADPTVEISGFSHFFGFRGLDKAGAARVNYPNIEEIAKNRKAGMAIAKSGHDEASYLAPFMESFGAATLKKGNFHRRGRHLV